MADLYGTVPGFSPEGQNKPRGKSSQRNAMHDRDSYSGHINKWVNNSRPGEEHVGILRGFETDGKACLRPYLRVEAVGGELIYCGIDEHNTAIVPILEDSRIVRSSRGYAEKVIAHIKKKYEESLKPKEPGESRISQSPIETMADSQAK